MNIANLPLISLQNVSDLSKLEREAEDEKVLKLTNSALRTINKKLREITDEKGVLYIEIEDDEFRSSPNIADKVCELLDEQLDAIPDIYYTVAFDNERIAGIIEVEIRYGGYKKTECVVC